jgi:hypothetical protein
MINHLGILHKCLAAHSLCLFAVYRGCHLDASNSLVWALCKQYFGGEKFTCKQGTQILNVRKFIFQVLICLVLYCCFSPKVCQSDLQLDFGPTKIIFPICCPTTHYQLVCSAGPSVQGGLDWIAKLGQGREDFVCCFPR